MRGRIVIIALLWAACTDGAATPRGLRAVADETLPDTYDAAVAWDPVRARLVLFGGSEDARTWVHDGTAWRVAATTGPGARFATNMTWDPVREAMVLFGGYRPRAFPTDALEYLNDTWLWDGQTWTALELPRGQRPSPRGDVDLTWDPTLRGPLMFGGSDERIAFRTMFVLTASAGWAPVPTP